MDAPTINSISESGAATMLRRSVTADVIARWSPHVQFHQNETYFPLSAEDMFLGSTAFRVTSDETKIQGSDIVIAALDQMATLTTDDWRIQLNPCVVDSSSSCASTTTASRTTTTAATLIPARLATAAATTTAAVTSISSNFVQAPMYVTVKIPTDASFVDIRYSFLFAFNGSQCMRAKLAPAFNFILLTFAGHQGDWEGITVRILPDLATPVTVTTEAHGNDTVWRPEEVEWTKETHVRICSALNSHASYPSTKSSQRDGNTAYIMLENLTLASAIDAFSTSPFVEPQATSARGAKTKEENEHTVVSRMTSAPLEQNNSDADNSSETAASSEADSTTARGAPADDAVSPNNSSVQSSSFDTTTGMGSHLLSLSQPQAAELLSNRISEDKAIQLELIAKTQSLSCGTNRADVQTGATTRMSGVAVTTADITAPSMAETTTLMPDDNNSSATVSTSTTQILSLLAAKLKPRTRQQQQQGQERHRAPTAAAATVSSANHQWCPWDLFESGFNVFRMVGNNAALQPVGEAWAGYGGRMGVYETNGARSVTRLDGAALRFYQAPQAWMDRCVASIASKLVASLRAGRAASGPGQRTDLVVTLPALFDLTSSSATTATSATTMTTTKTTTATIAPPAPLLSSSSALVSSLANLKRYVIHSCIHSDLVLAPSSITPTTITTAMTSAAVSKEPTTSLVLDAFVPGDQRQQWYFIEQAVAQNGTNPAYTYSIVNVNSEQCISIFANREKLYGVGRVTALGPRVRTDAAAMWSLSNMTRITNLNTSVAIRPHIDDSQNLNVLGNGPYGAGAPVATWVWGKGDANETWNIISVEQEAPGA